MGTRNSSWDIFRASGAAIGLGHEGAIAGQGRGGAEQCPAETATTSPLPPQPRSAPLGTSVLGNPKLACPPPRPSVSHDRVTI